MILADTSIWIDHLRSADEALAELLDGDEIAIHPLVIGEVAIGNFPNRLAVLAELHRLSQVLTASEREVLILINEQQLHGRGLSYPDAHLLTSCLLTPEAELWTRDKTLAAAADKLGVGWSPVG